MRVLITGSRDWVSWRAVWRELDLVFADIVQHLPDADRVLTVVHGNCPQGADAFAHLWCVEEGRERAEKIGINFWEERHPAKWNSLGRRAGFIRNAEMVDLGADVLLAFSRVCTSPTCRVKTVHGSHGAGHTVELAEKAGIEIRGFREGW